MSLLGIDVGTTGCKAAAFSLAGNCLASAYREYPSILPQQGWAELDSRLVWSRVCEVLAEVAFRTAADPVTALCISSMGEAMTPVSRDREILGNSIVSSDTRGAEYIAALKAKIDQRAFYNINPNILGPQYSLPKLLWTREHAPAVYEKADKFLLWGDLVAYMLGGDAVTSLALANRTLLLDIRTEDWSDTLLAATGIPRTKLPVPRPSGTVAGQVSDAMAAKLGLPRGVAIVVGAHDQCCNALGGGITRAGKAVCGIGTYECITPVYDHIPDTDTMLANGLNVEHHVLPGLYVSFIYNQSGALVRWFRDTFAAADRRLVPAGEDIYDRLTREMPAEPSRLLVLPYFEMTGPPGFVPDAAGAIVGLKMDTSRGEILKAIMESVSFYFAEATNALKAVGIDTSAFIATGGGAKSDAWLQIKADVFGVPFLRPRYADGSVFGAAMLAGLATGKLTSPAEAVAQWVKIERAFEPDAKRHARYREKQAAYRQLYPTLEPLLRGA